MYTMKTKNSNHGFVRVATAVPKMKVGDIDYNIEQILDFAKKAEQKGSSVTVFPELAITGYTLGDLFHQRLLIKKVEEALGQIAKESKNIKSILLVGLPLSFERKLFNTAAIINNGKILGLVPKTFLPNYKEFYEERWFSSSRDLLGEEVSLFGKKVPIGNDLL